MPVIEKKPGGYTVRVSVNKADLEHLRKLSERVNMPQSDIMARLLSAGIAAVVEKGYRLPLPFAFTMMEPLEDGASEAKPPPTRR